MIAQPCVQLPPLSLHNGFRTRLLGCWFPIENGNLPLNPKLDLVVGRSAIADIDVGSDLSCGRDDLVSVYQPIFAGGVNFVGPLLTAHGYQSPCHQDAEATRLALAHAPADQNSMHVTGGPAGSGA